MSSQWEIQTREVTFTTGRTAVIRQTISMREVSRHALALGETDVADAIVRLQNGMIEDVTQGMRLQDAIARSMFVEPQIGAPDDLDSNLTLRQALTEASQASDLDAAHEIAGAALKAQPVPLTALEDSEIQEVLEIAFGGIADAARFRAEGSGDSAPDSADAGGSEPRADGDELESPAVELSGDAEGERRGVSARPGPGDADPVLDAARSGAGPGRHGDVVDPA